MVNARPLLLAGCTLGLATPLAAQWTSAPDGNDIVVTAQKRSESIQAVPFSITTFSQAELEERGVQSVYDLSRSAPSLTVVSSGPGENNLIIRGISSIAGSAATVGYYFDDTPIAASSNAALLSTRGVIDPSALDIARIEVLRRPQGTLYGSSSMGGTVRYIANQPDATKIEGNVGADLSGTDHGGFNYNLNAVVNAPIVTDRIALRIAAYYRRDDGFIDRYPIDPANYLGIRPGSSAQQNVNTYETYGARASLLLKLGDTLSLTLSIFDRYTKLGSSFTFDGVPGSLDNPIQVRDVPEPNVQKSLIANLTIKKQARPIEIVSSSSYYDRRVRITEDASKVVSYFFATPTVEPVGITGNYVNHEFTQEVRASSSFDGPFQFIVGGFYHHVVAPLASSIPFPSGYAYRTLPPFDSFATIYAGTRRSTLDEYASFGEVLYQIPAQPDRTRGLARVQGRADVLPDRQRPVQRWLHLGL